MRIAVCLVVALCLASPALVADELRLSYYLSQEEVDFSPRGSDGIDDEWDDNERFELAAYSNLGTIWGFGVITQRAEVADEDWDLEYDSWSLRIYSGKAPIANETFTWEVVGYSGFGMASADLSRDGGRKGGSDRDFLLEFGAQTSLSFNLSRSFLVGAGGGYGWSQVKLDLDGDRNVDQQGLFYFGYAGWRF